jgi:hypothetical protein
MKTKLIALGFLLALAGCNARFEELQLNPNVAGENSVVPPSYLLDRVLFEVYNGGGVTDGRPGNVYEGPWEQLMRWNQFTAGNNNNYGGSNFYAWAASATPYNQIKNLDRMVQQAERASGNPRNAYAALAKFLRAYTYLWYTQRVGDIPMSEAGQGLANLTPKFDAQKDVYAACLKLLDEANADLTALLPTLTSATNIEGDIFYNNDLRLWQRAINSYTLRVLVSLSKRADDTPELGIKQKFAEIVGNPTKYPLMRTNADNLQFRFNAQYNQYPTFYIALYADQLNVSKTYLELTTAAQDPRTFIAATPAPAELRAGKTISDFGAYIGADNAKSQSVLVSDATAGKYSFANYLRYINQGVILNPPEPYTLLGYPELCFNIAEGINRGWATGDAASFYNAGIRASLAFYNLADGTVLPVGDAFGRPYGNVTVSVSNFLSHARTVYKGNTAEGLTQILQQKYVAMFQNSGWEAFYNQRRTGVPVFAEGVGTNAAGRIPKRWRYPAEERNNNPANTDQAIQRQYGGNDDLYGLMWLLK